MKYLIIIFSFTILFGSLIVINNANIRYASVECINNNGELRYFHSNYGFMRGGVFICEPDEQQKLAQYEIDEKIGLEFNNK